MPKLTTTPSLGRSGTYYHEPTNQFCSRIGFCLNAAGRRVRASQNLGTPDNANAATIKHIALCEEWQWIKAEWPRIQRVLRHGLPDYMRDVAELDLPVWIKEEWWQAGREAGHAALIDEIRRGAQLGSDLIDGGRDILRLLTDSPHRHVERLPQETRALVYHQLAPPAHEVLGYAADAERLTLGLAKQRYVDDLKSRIGLAEDGIKQGTYTNMTTMLRLGLELKITGADGAERYALDANTPLETITRDDLIAYKRGWLGKVSAGDVAKRTAANYVKAVQYMFGWLYKRERIVTRRVPDLDDVFKFTGINPIKVPDYANVLPTLKAILKQAPDRTRLHVYLALNCGYYQSDIGHLKLSEIIEKDGERFAVRRREKTSHQNDFTACHALWPETLALLDKFVAPGDTEKNPGGWALINRDGKPIYQNNGSCKSDNITCAYFRAVQSLNAERAKKKLEPVSLPFKMFRKLGATAMNNLAGEQVQKLYRAATFEGADRFYLRADFTPLTAALKTWRAALVTDGILY